MSFDDLKNITKGFLKGWKKGKMKEKILELAKDCMDEKVKVAHLEEKIRQQKEEILRLKGEKRKPKIKPAAVNEDLNKKPKKKHQKKYKKKDIEIDREVKLKVDKSSLPDDAKFVGFRDVVVEEIELKRNNIKFLIPRYYSKSLGKIFEGEIPVEYQNHSFGPQLRSFVTYQFYKLRSPHKKIIEMVRDCFGIVLSAGTLCSILNNLDETFKEDIKSARKSAIKKQSRVFIDDTGARVKGVSAYTFSVSNDYFTQFTTGFEKNRWAAIGALLGGVERFKIDREAIGFIANKLKRAVVTSRFYKYQNLEFRRKEFEEKLLEILSKSSVKVAT